MGADGRTGPAGAGHPRRSGHGADRSAERGGLESVTAGLAMRKRIYNPNAMRKALNPAQFPPYPTVTDQKQHSWLISDSTRHPHLLLLFNPTKKTTLSLSLPKIKKHPQTPQPQPNTHRLTLRRMEPQRCAHPAARSSAPTHRTPPASAPRRPPRPPAARPRRSARPAWRRGAPTGAAPTRAVERRGP